MMGHRRRGEAAQIVADRRRREDEAPRLHAEVPLLTSLSLSIDEGRPGHALGGSTHIRRFVVERAPALFVVPCNAAGCEGGVHDMTRTVMKSLLQSSMQFQDETGCDACDCVLRHVGTAAFVRSPG